MLGAIIGDVAGSYYRQNGKNTKNVYAPLFVNNSRFTSTSVAAIAIADAILNDVAYDKALRQWACRYPESGFGKIFMKWANDDSGNMGTCKGNGAAKRAVPIGWAFGSLDKVLQEAAYSALPTHNSNDGVKAAQAVAAAVFMAAHGAAKDEIRSYTADKFGYNMNRTIGEIRPEYSLTNRAADSVPEAIICFLDSNNFTDALHLAISLGGDATALASISGAIAEAYYGVKPAALLTEIPSQHLPTPLYDVANNFYNKYCADTNRDLDRDLPDWKPSAAELDEADAQERYKEKLRLYDIARKDYRKTAVIREIKLREAKYKQELEAKKQAKDQAIALRHKYHASESEPELDR